MSPVSLTYRLTQCNAERFLKKRFGEKEVEAALQRLDRLTQDEARTTAAQILKVVHALFENMNVAMGGEQKLLSLSCIVC